MSLLDGSIDFKYPDNKDWRSDLKGTHKVIYSVPVVNYVDGVMVLPKNRGKGKVALKKLGAVRDFTAWDYLDDIKAKRMVLVENNSFTGVLQQVLNGYIDGVYCNVVVGSYHLSEVLKQSGGLVFDPGLPHTRGGYTLSTTKHPKVIEEFNAFLTEKKDLVNRLKIKYQIDKGLN
jgi:ABC-type amino acid transport substrate-binding protein